VNFQDSAQEVRNFKNGRFRIICPCGLNQLKKKKRMAVRSTLPLEPAHFDDVFHLQSVSGMSAGNINVLTNLSAFSGAASAGMLYM
jgi:hypothetical protein